MYVIKLAILIFGCPGDTHIINFIRMSLKSIRRLTWRRTHLGTERVWWWCSRMWRGTSANLSRRLRLLLPVSLNSGSNLEKDLEYGAQTPMNGKSIKTLKMTFVRSKQASDQNNSLELKIPSFDWYLLRYLTQFAAAKAGLILVNINPAYQHAELKYCLNKVNLSLVLISLRTKNFVGWCRWDHCQCKLQVTRLSQASLSGFQDIFMKIYLYM